MRLTEMISDLLLCVVLFGVIATFIKAMRILKKVRGYLKRKYGTSNNRERGNIS